MIENKLAVDSLLITAIVTLSTVIVYLYKSRDRIIETKDKDCQSLLKDKDDKIMAVIESHQKDLKEANNDMKIFVDKYHQFTQQLKDVVNARNISK